MKLVTVQSDGDYGAAIFENAGFNTPDMLHELWDKANQAGGVVEVDVPDEPDEPYAVTVESYEFGDVDPKFVKLIQSEFVEYSEHSNFYVVEA